MNKYKNTKYAIKDGKKLCRSCKELLPLESFHKAAESQSGLAYDCKPCKAAGRKKDPGKHFMLRYGISLEGYITLSEEQGGRCKICQIIPKKLVVDHCHVSGKVRGLLCYRCNNLLGMAQDKTEILLEAVSYLKTETKLKKPVI